MILFARSSADADGTDEGLYLAVFPLFRPGHPPLLIDWSQLAAFEPKKFLWSTRYATRIQVGDSGTVGLEIYNKKVVEGIEEYLTTLMMERQAGVGGEFM